MGWDRSEARSVKEQAASYIADLLADRDVASAQRLGGERIGDEPGPVTVGVALGLAPAPDGSYGLAVRYRLGTPSARMVARRLRNEIGPAVDIRRTGRVQRLRGPMLPTAQAAGETGRVRPLQPGLSAANVGVTAGTLGAFVHRDDAVHALSNHHVFVGSRGEVGDPILQPGPFDGGSDPEDRIGTLATFVALAAGEPAVVDAALALLDDGIEFDTSYPSGFLCGTAEVGGGEEVEKAGRTTGVTQGVVSAIELDGLLVDFGPPFGTLQFDGQIEVEGSGEATFSQGGDSGSLVYQPGTMTAVGLLFAGSASGGANSRGLTYLNPIDLVLRELEATLILGERDEES